MKLFVPSVTATACLLVLHAPLHAANPLPPITKSGLTLELVDFVQLPAATAPQLRDGINFLAEAPDNSGRLYVNDSRGGIYIIDNGAVLPHPFLNLSLAPHVAGEPDIDLLIGNFGQQGIGGFALHPDFGNPGTEGYGKLYTAHSDNPAGKPTPDFPSPGATTHHSVITEWRFDPLNPNSVDLSSHRELLRIGQPFRDHNMQQIGFNPLASPGDADYGMLYVSMGDGGNNFPVSVTDPYEGGQNPGTPLGAILRIDPLGNNSANGRYGIPADNPFVGDVDLQHTLSIDESLTPGDETLAEVWAYGLRNPHRFGWDTGLNGTANMFISDIGQASIEEINLGMPGANYGWRDREGAYATDPNDQDDLYPLPADDALYGYSYPVAQYDHDEGNAIVAGGVYRGPDVSLLQGQYVFADFVKGRLFHADVDDMTSGTPGSQADVHELTILYNGVEQSILQIIGNAPRADLRFGTDSHGELYLIVKRTGQVFRIQAPTTIPGDLDGDGFVGINDLNLVLDHWNQTVAARDPEKGDPSGDGFVGIEDLNYVLGHWNTGTPPGEWSSVPEPTCACLLGLCVGVIVGRRPASLDVRL